MDITEPRPKTRSSRSTVKRTTTKVKNAKNEPDLQSRIAVTAYFKAQARGFTPGYELEDWLAAEKEEVQ